MGTPHIVGDAVLVQTATTGTGTYSLGNALTGYLTFALAGVPSGSRVCYTVVDSLTAPTMREVVEGVYTSGTPATLTRARIVRTHTGGTSAVNWSSGTRYIFLTPNADRLALLDTDGLLARNSVQPSLLTRITRSASQSIPNSTATVISFTENGGDSLASLSGAGPYGGITLASDGVYLVNVVLPWASNTTGVRSLSLVLNGASTLDTDNRQADQVGSVTNRVTLTAPLVAGSSLAAVVSQNSGGALNVAGSSLTVVKL